MAEFGDSGAMMNLYAGSEAQQPPNLDQGDLDNPVAVKTEPVRAASRGAAVASSPGIKREKSAGLPSGNQQSKQNHQAAAIAAVVPAAMPADVPSAMPAAVAVAVVALPVMPKSKRATRVKQEPTAPSSSNTTRTKAAEVSSSAQAIEISSDDAGIASDAATLNSSDEDQVEMMDILDHRGDLIVQIPSKTPLGTPSRFRVCSRTLYRASSYLEKEYNRDDSPPPRGVARDKGKAPIKKIVISHIDPKAFGVILRIIHGKLAEVNIHLRDLALFNEVLSVTHQLKMDSCLIPVAAKWLKRVYDNDATRFDELGPQLWITHQLGRTRLLRQTILAIVIGGRVNADGELLGFGAADEQPFITLGSLRHIPELVHDLTRARASVMETLIDKVNLAIDRLVTGSAASPVCAAIVHHVRCDCTMLGAFERCLASAGWTRALMVDDGTVRVRPPLTDLRSSPRQLHKRIRSIVNKTVGMAVSTAGHAQCDPWGGERYPAIEELVKKAAEEIQVDEEGMKKRSELMGFDEE